MGRTLRFLGLGLSLCLTPLTTIAAGLPRPAVDFPLPVDSYHDQKIPSILGNSRRGFSGEGGISPLYLFLGALVPTFIAGAAFMLLP